MGVLPPLPEPPGWLEQALAPRALLAGALAGFVACCLAGHRASDRDPLPRSVERFHYYLSPETLYYPTPGQLCAFARRHLDRDRVAVVIAGSSILQGVGQPEERAWTHRLRALLGDEFRVVNLAMRSGKTAEVGTQVAEMLLAEFPRLLVVADAHLSWLHPEPDGYRYRSFYWDARAQGRLPAFPERDRRLAQMRAEMAADAQAHGQPPRHTAAPAELDEMQCGAAVDSLLRFRELWNAVAVRYVSTVWVPASGTHFYRPRARYRDEEGEAPPPGQRDPAREAALRQAAASMFGESLSRLAAEVQTAPGVVPAWESLAADVRALLPEQLRGRAVLVQMRMGRSYLGTRSPEEWAAYDRLFASKAACLRRLGLTVLDVGRDFPAEDFADHGHLTPSGGEKLAAAVATAVRALARRRGYLSGDGP